MEVLLQLGAELNGLNEEGETAVMHAVSNNAQAVLRVLLGVGADTSIKRKDGADAWFIAYRDQRSKCIEMLTDQRDQIRQNQFQIVPTKRYDF